MGRYGFSVLKMDKEKKNILKVETFCFNRNIAVEECQRLQKEQPMYCFTYTETDITEVLTKEEIQKQEEEYIRFVRMAEAIENKEEILD